MGGMALIKADLSSSSDSSSFMATSKSVTLYHNLFDSSNLFRDDSADFWDAGMFHKGCIFLVSLEHLWDAFRSYKLDSSMGHPRTGSASSSSPSGPGSSAIRLPVEEAAVFD